MRPNYLFIAIVFSVLSCNNSEAKKSENSTMESYENPPTNSKSSKNGIGKSSTNSSNGSWEKLVMNEISDGKGGVAAIVPMPAGWKFVNGGIAGPHGVKVTNFATYSFMMNYNHSLDYAYANQKMRSLPDIETIIQQDFVPDGNKRNLTYIKSYEIPEISKMDKWYTEQLFKAMPSVSTAKAYGSDWKYDNGKSFFLLIHVNSSTSDAMQQWYFYSSSLEAEPAYFEKAKKQYIFALANQRYNIEPIKAYNKEEAERCGKSWATFNKKMAANQAAFEANQIAHVNKSNAINATIMSNYKANDIASDKRQEQTIDGIYERTNVQNSETGKIYKVQEGANQYWMNNDGEYIGTKSSTYNPNLDDNMNDQKWEELKKIKK